jgi:hypothetical protein
MKKLVVAGISMALSLAAGAALADETAPPRREPLTIRVEIKVRRQQPLAAIAVGRVEAAVAARNLRQPFVDRIEQSATREPF